MEVYFSPFLEVGSLMSELPAWSVPGEGPLPGDVLAWPKGVRDQRE